jgi:hypothetical protein
VEGRGYLGSWFYKLTTNGEGKSENSSITGIYPVEVLSTAHRFPLKSCGNEGLKPVNLRIIKKY